MNNRVESRASIEVLATQVVVLVSPQALKRHLPDERPVGKKHKLACFKAADADLMVEFGPGGSCAYSIEADDPKAAYAAHREVERRLKGESRFRHPIVVFQS